MAEDEGWTIGQERVFLQPADIYVVETERGFTEKFGPETIASLERLGLIRHLRDGHVLEDGEGRPVGPLHRFYGPATH